MKTYDQEDEIIDLQVRIRPETLHITPDIISAGWYEYLPFPIAQQDASVVQMQPRRRTQRRKAGRTTFSCSQVIVVALAAVGFGIAYGLTVTLLERVIG